MTNDAHGMPWIVKAVRPMRGFKLHITFATGERGIYDAPRPGGKTRSALMVEATMEYIMCAKKE